MEIKYHWTVTVRYRRPCFVETSVTYLCGMRRDISERQRPNKITPSFVIWKEFCRNLSVLSTTIFRQTRVRSCNTSSQSTTIYSPLKWNMGTEKNCHFLDTFAKLRKGTVTRHICQSTWKNSASTGQILMKFYISVKKVNQSRYRPRVTQMVPGS